MCKWYGDNIIDVICINQGGNEMNFDENTKEQLIFVGLAIFFISIVNLNLDYVQI